MCNFSESKTLVETFEPGKGENAEYDNWGGVMIERLEIAVLSITKAKVMEDTSYLKDSAIMTMFDALDWYKSVFKELRDNTANEVLVDRFLKGNLKFTDIPKYVEMVMDKAPNVTGHLSLEQVLEADKEARRMTEGFLK